MIRRLLLLVVIGLIAWLIRSLSRSRRSRPVRSRPPDPHLHGGESMVRDRICNTYLPRDRAVVLTHGGQDHFFCSETCRNDFLSQADSAP